MIRVNKLPFSSSNASFFKKAQGFVTLLNLFFESFKLHEIGGSFIS